MAASPTVAATAVTEQHHNAAHGHVVEHHDGRAHDHLEQEHLDRDGRGLAQEDRAAVEPGQPQSVAGAVRLFDRERPPDREQNREQDRGPEEARRRLVQQRPVGIECEREQHHDNGAERDDLLQRDARTAFDPQVFARDKQCIAQEAHACASSSGTGRGSGAARRQRDFVDLARDDAHLAGREPAREVELVRREHHGAAVGRRAPHDVLQHLATVLVEAGVRFVEQQQARLAGRARSRATGGAVVLATAGRARRSRPAASPTRSNAASASATE